MTVTREDLKEFNQDIKKHIDDRFVAHEKQETLMFTPLLAEIKEQHQILHGTDNRGGLIRDANMFRWVAGGGLFAGLSGWFKDFIGMFTSNS